MALPSCQASFPHRTEPNPQSQNLPTLQGNKVSLRLSRQVDAPNQCSSANSLFMSLARHWHTCIALRVLRCTTQFVTLLATPTAFVRAATCVLRPTSFITSYVPLPLHHVRSYSAASFHGFPPASTQSHHTAGSTFHSAIPTLQYSPGFINASLRPAFISVGFSPPAANNFACLACLPRLRVCHGFCPTLQKA